MPGISKPCDGTTRRICIDEGESVASFVNTTATEPAKAGCHGSDEVGTVAGERPPDCPERSEGLSGGVVFTKLAGGRFTVE